jgi:hypothetical protein
MKINLSILTILFFTTLISCSQDKLTKDMAKSMVIDCQKRESYSKTRRVSYGTVQQWDIFKNKFLNFLKIEREFEKLGLLKIGKLQRIKGDMGFKDSYEITLTPKGKKHLLKSETDYKGEITGKFVTCEYKFENIAEIHEIPEKNIAKVKIRIIRFNETPFFEESKSTPKEKFEFVMIRKTTDGWKLCDKK